MKAFNDLASACAAVGGAFMYAWMIYYTFAGALSEFPGVQLFILCFGFLGGVVCLYGIRDFWKGKN